MTWQIFLAISVLSISLSILFQKKIAAGKNIDSITLSIGFQLFVGLVLGVILLFRGNINFDFSGIGFYLLLMLFIYSAANIAKFTALKGVDASEFTIFMPINAVASVFAAMLFLGEDFSFVQLAGLLLVISAIFVVSKRSDKKLRLNKYQVLALVSSALMGLGFVNDAFILRSSDVLVYTMLAFAGPAIVTSLFYPKKAMQLPQLFKKENALFFLPSAFLYGTGAVTVYYAYQAGRNAAQIQSLNQLTIIITVILSVIFLRERERLTSKIIAATLAMIGAILLI